MITIACIVGTRPEAIKMAPVIAKLKQQPRTRTLVIATAQHRELADDVFNLFGIVPDIDLDLMQHGQGLSQLLARAVTGIDDMIVAHRIDLVVAQGDTTSVMAAAMACFHRGIPFLHVEAGLRSFDLANPFPEELNRIVASRIAALHFAPTARARSNLLAEGVASDRIIVTGNTVIDALRQTASLKIELPVAIEPGRRLLLVTVHRRENLGQPLRNICRAVESLIAEYPDIEVLWPTHPNPEVEQTVRGLLGAMPRVHLIRSMRYDEFVAALKGAFLILTDSGGIQEEAPVFSRPVLVLRRETERPEAIEANVARLVGTETEAILRHTRELLDDPGAYKSMATGVSPFGDGKASERIARAIEERFATARAAPAQVN